MKLKFSFREHFQLSRKERNAYLLFTALLFLFSFTMQWRNRSNNELYLPPKAEVDSSALSEPLQTDSQPESSVKSVQKRYKKPSQNIRSKPININRCDSIDLVKLRGIGPVYSSRIMKYRGLLGGYVNVNQITEVYGISDSLFQVLRPKIYCEGEVEKLHINKASFKQLLRHPYLDYAMVKKITAYKKVNGRVSNFSTVKDILAVDSSKVKRLQPYLSFD